MLLALYQHRHIVRSTFSDDTLASLGNTSTIYSAARSKINIVMSQANIRLVQYAFIMSSLYIT